MRRATRENGRRFSIRSLHAILAILSSGRTCWLHLPGANGSYRGSFIFSNDIRALPRGAGHIARMQLWWCFSSCATRRSPGRHLHSRYCRGVTRNWMENVHFVYYCRKNDKISNSLYSFPCSLLKFNEFLFLDHFWVLSLNRNTSTHRGYHNNETYCWEEHYQKNCPTRKSIRHARGHLCLAYVRYWATFWFALWIACAVVGTVRVHKQR